MYFCIKVNNSEVWHSKFVSFQIKYFLYLNKNNYFKWLLNFRPTWKNKIFTQSENLLHLSRKKQLVEQKIFLTLSLRITNFPNKTIFQKNYLDCPKKKIFFKEKKFLIHTRKKTKNVLYLSEKLNFLEWKKVTILTQKSYLYNIHVHIVAFYLFVLERLWCLSGGIFCSLSLLPQ